MDKKVFIALVTWNGSRFIKNCLDSLAKQSYQDYEIQILDNGSQDNTREILRRDYQNIFVEYHDQNLGFARAYNKLMLRARNDYILILNQDVVLEEHFLEELVKTLDNNEKVAAVGPCLYRLIDFQKSNYFDSLGLKIDKYYNVEDDYAGVKDENLSFPNEFEVFGISGAITLFRRSALESVRFENEYFDNDFFAYKEDVDLAMRLRLLSWKAMINMKSVAYHYRTGKKDNNLSLIQQYRKKSNFVKLYSFRNHKLFLVKTAQWHKYALYILWKEFSKSIFVLLFSPKIFFKALKQFFNLKKRILQKRKKILPYIKTVDLSKWIK